VVPGAASQRWGCSGAMRQTALGNMRTSRMDLTPAFIQRLDAQLDDQPLKKCTLLIVIFVIPISIVALVPTVVDALVSQNNLLIFVAYTAIRKTVTWLANLFTFFYYVNQARVGHMEGSGQLTEAGGLVIMGTWAAVICGLLTMVLCMALPSHLLEFLTPDPSNRTLVSGIARNALVIAAIWIPGQVFLGHASGVLLGQRIIVPLYIGVVGPILVGTGVAIGIVVSNTCDDQLAAANVTGTDAETWVCPDAESFLNATSLAFAGENCAVFAYLFWLMFRTSRNREYFKEKGYSLFNYLSEADQANGFTRDQLGTALRSILNNSKEVVTFACAAKIGITEAAVWSMFESLGDLAYGVPNLCATPAMFFGAHLLGEGRHRDFARLLNFYAVVALLFALAFLVLALLTFDSSASDIFANKVQRDEFVAKARPIMTMAIILNPMRSLIGVYGPLIIAVHRFVTWGAIVFFCFFVIFLPITIVGVNTSSLNTLVAAHVAYFSAHLLSLLVVIHLIEVPKLRAATAQTSPSPPSPAKDETQMTPGANITA